MLALKPPKLDSCQDIKNALAKNIAFSKKVGLFSYGERLNGLDYCDVEDEKKYKELELAEKELRLIKNRIAGPLTVRNLVNNKIDILEEITTSAAQRYGRVALQPMETLAQKAFKNKFIYSPSDGSYSIERDGLREYISREQAVYLSCKPRDAWEKRGGLFFAYSNMPFKNAVQRELELDAGRYGYSM